MGSLSASTSVAGCTRGRRTTARAPPACPAGYEGPGCNIDINECSRGTSGCDPNAACTNTAGGFSCACYQGYSGDGTSCAPTPELAAVQAQYQTDGPARLACSEGQGLPYREGAPGFAYDVTGALARVKNGGQQVCAGCGQGGPMAVEDGQPAGQMQSTHASPPTHPPNSPHPHPFCCGRTAWAPVPQLSQSAACWPATRPPDATALPTTPHSRSASLKQVPAGALALRQRRCA